MEFPDLGKHCSDPTCKQLDFLPVKCDACSKIFCNEHFPYEQHRCPEAYKKDNQVPVCPLCNAPIPVKKGEAPDYVVGLHIDNDCQSDPAKSKRKIYTNRCRKKGCKQKELIPFNCNRCQLNYCIKHRLEEDHDCQGFQGSGRAGTSSGAAAAARASASKTSSSSSGPFKSTGSRKPQQTALSFMGQDLDRERRARQAGQQPHRSHAQSVQPGMSEDEAMAAAIAASLTVTTTTSQPTQASRSPTDATKRRQEEEDLALARALQASEQEARQNRGAKYLRVC